MQFGNLQYLYLVWILPAMILLAVYGFRKKQQLLRSFADPSLWPRLLPGASRRRQVFKFLLILAGVGLVLAALLQPRWGFHWEEIKRKGVDLLVAVDVSESMLAEDIQPNRLERAKRELTDLVNMLRGDRIGLIAFSGASFLQCPLTLDYGAFRIFLDYLDPELIPVPGTAIGQAILTAAEAFEPGRRASRALILITDGEDLQGKAEQAAQQAKEKGIRIFTIGIGSDQPAPIPLRDGGGDFKKDRSGQVVMSRMQESLLQKIALTTGGSYVRSVTGDMDLKKIYEEEICKKMEAGELKSTQRRKWEERFQWFLFTSVLLLALESFLSERNREKGKKASEARKIRLKFWARIVLPAVSLAVPVAGLAPPAVAESVVSKIRKAESSYGEQKYDKALEGFLDAQVERPEDPPLRYDVGNAHYRMHDYANAEKAFRSVIGTSEPTLEPKASYNLGNCAYRQGKLEEAVAFYQRALELDPQDEDARFNLEFVRQEIKRRLEEAKKREAQPEQDRQSGSGQSCPNPQAGQSQEKQTGEEKQASEAPSQAQQSPPQTGPAGEAQPPQAAEQERGPQGEEARGAAGSVQEMSPEEAERWLNTLDEDQRELVKRQMQDRFGRREQRPEKDW